MQEHKTTFAAMPNEFRMKAREIIDTAGGMVAGYYGGACQVAMPADEGDCREMTRQLEAAGLIGEDRFTWFPLGSDNPPDTLRHYGIGSAACPRGDRPSYWKYRNFFVSE